METTKQAVSAQKTIFMTMVALIASLLSEGGIPHGKLAWIVFGITVIGSLASYIAKTYILPSVTPAGEIDYRDLLGAAMVGLGTGLSNWIATLVVGIGIDWSTMLAAVIPAILGAVVKAFAFGKTPVEKK